MKRLFLILITMLLPLCGWAEKQGYAVFNKSKGTLTFKYGEKPDGDNVYDTDDTWNDGLWFLWDREQLKKVIFDASFAKARPKSTANWFALAESLKQIVGIEYLNTSKVVNMSNMFHYCAALTSLDVSHFDTSNVTDMSYMFSQCSGLTSLDVSHFNTSKVTNMMEMFGACWNLTSLNVSNFNTSKVTNMAGMFRNISFAELDLTSFDTRNVTNMDNMFNYCWQNLKRIYAGDKWSTKKVKSSKNMFENCNKLEGGLGTVFNEKYIDATYARIDGGTSSPGYLTSVEQKNKRGYAVFDSSTGTLAFKYGAKPSGDNVFDTETGYTPYPIWDRPALKKVVFDSSYAKARPRSTDSWFYGAESLTQIVGIEYLNTSNVENMSSMFYMCTSLTSLDVSHFNTSNVTSMYQMFWGCEKLTSLDLSHFDTRKVTKIAEMFMFCSSLSRLDLSNFDTSHVDDFQGLGYMFAYCENLTSLDISNFNTSKITVMNTMFINCKNLTKIDLSSFDTRKVVNMNQMFAGCTALTTINVGDKWSVASVTGDESMFAECRKLVGGKGTTFDANHVGKEYARIDGGPDAPGYLTGKGGAPEPDDVTITAKSYTIAYGDAIPTLEYTTKGAALKGTPTLTCDATSASPVGTYDIKVGMGSVTNEKVSLVDGTLTITKAPLTISAGNYTKKLGEENPTFTPTYKGFKNNETEAVLTKQPTVTTTATKDSPAGTYDVTVSGAEAQNYEITYKNGTLTIETRPIEKGEFIYDNVVYIYGVDNGLFAEVKEGDAFSAGSPDAAGEVKILPWVVVNANRYMVIRINGSAFKANKKITRVVIPGSVQSIWGHAFKDCTSLEEVVIEKPEADMPSDGLKHIYKDAAFAGCTSLRSINLPSTLTNLGYDERGGGYGSVFEGCSSLTSITIPSGVNGISRNTFKNCTALKKVDIKGRLKAIESDAFLGCTSLESIDLSNGIKEAIGENAFHSCASLKTVKLPTDGEYKIGRQCFKNCTSLESITIPDAVTEIGSYVCQDCKGMKVAVIERRSKTWEPSALFLNCTSLKEASIGWEGRLPSRIFEGCTSLESVTLTKYTDEIGESAFNGCKSLKELLLSERIKAVENSAFAYCSSLESIAFTEALTSLGACVFYNCKSMKVIDLSKCTDLTITNTYRDKNNTNLVFSGVPETTIILLPNHSGGLIENEDVSYEFQEDNTVAVADGSEAAGEYEIPEAIEHDGVEYPVAAIEAEAFKDNTNLTQVSIPGSIQSIGEEAFAGCINLSAIYAFATEPIPLGAGVTGTRAEGSSVFAGVDLENCVLYVPKGCVEKYRSAEGWGEFAHIVEMDMTAIWTLRYDEQEVDKYYNLHGQQVAHPGKGVYIKNGKKMLKR